MTHIATPSHLITDGVGGIFELPSENAVQYNRHGIESLPMRDRIQIVIEAVSALRAKAAKAETAGERALWWREYQRGEQNAVRWIARGCKGKLPTIGFDM
ncbi:MAG TPA: hypothetical protein DCS97_06050 [Planctomycetes bacterium]|nr:hypothetical protein [Planctomycetota bacterium]